jgi:3-oxoacyl-[acyl-carrier-protein] synthase-3
VTGMNRTTKTALRGTGSSLPDRVVTNDEFVATIDTSDEWIRTRTGIRERRFAGPVETSGSLGISAARKALVKANLSAADLDLIVCATVTPDMMTPANACGIQAALGCRPIPAFDISAACTGFLYAMSVADQFIRAGSARNVLIVGAETLSRAMDLTDRNTCILFGDGAGAAILSAVESGDEGIHLIRLYSDGLNQHLIQVPGMVTPQSGDKPHRHLRMNGREVFRFAVCRMIELIEEAMLECQRTGRKIDLLIPHQVNQRIIDSALESTDFPADRVMVNLDRYGNTSAASVPIALDEALEVGRAKPGDTVLLVAFGGGLTWGSAIMTL